MKLKFEVHVRSVLEIQELPDAWTSEDYKNLLELADFEDWDEIDESELKDYTIMALQDLEEEEAAAVVLGYKFQGRLTKGQIQSIVYDMMEVNIWEEYQNIGFHQDLYNCAVLLRSVFPKKFPETDAVKCVVAVDPLDHTAEKALLQPDKTLLVRLLADGMTDHAVIKRLFDDQLAGGAFPEAEHIIWHFDSEFLGKKAIFTIFSSWYWLRPLDEVSNYTSGANASPTKTG